MTDGTKGETNEAEEIADELLDVTVEGDGVMVVTIAVGEEDDMMIAEDDMMIVEDDMMIEEREVEEMMVGLGEQLVVMTEEDEVEAVVIASGEVGGMPMVQDEGLDAMIQGSVAGPKVGKK